LPLILLRPVVYAVVLVEIAETAVEMVVGYAYLVGGWGNQTVVKVTPTTFLLQPAFIAVGGCLVQHFFIWRIWTFSHFFGGRTSKLLTKSICVLISLVS
jgi:hypothetical protein